MLPSVLATRSFLMSLPVRALQIWKENGLRGLYFGYSLHTLRDTVSEARGFSDASCY